MRSYLTPRDAADADTGARRRVGDVIQQTIPRPGLRVAGRKEYRRLMLEDRAYALATSDDRVRR